MFNNTAGVTGGGMYISESIDIYFDIINVFENKAE